MFAIFPSYYFLPLEKLKIVQCEDRYWVNFTTTVTWIWCGINRRTEASCFLQIVRNKFS